MSNAQAIEVLQSLIEKLQAEDGAPAEPARAEPEDHNAIKAREFEAIAASLGMKPKDLAKAVKQGRFPGNEGFSREDYQRKERYEHDLKAYRRGWHQHRVNQSMSPEEQERVRRGY